MIKEELHFQSRRSPVFGRRGMIATSQPLAVQAGLEMLNQGGSAADAAVATAAALNVTEPTSTGIGGDCFALYYEASTRQISALNGSGRAPSDLSIELLREQGFGDTLPPFHAHTVTVPGACAGWCDLHKRFGRLPLTSVLAPAIRLAEDGFPVSPITAFFWARGVERQLSSAPGGIELTLGGRAPKAGEIFYNPCLARTLRVVAERGSSAFYQGEIASAIANAIQGAGGLLTIEDLAAHQSTWEEPISTTYRGLRIWECPPNGQGLTALIALNILEQFNLSKMSPLGSKRLHLIIEALRLAFADARWYINDPTFNPVPIEKLLSKTYAEHRRHLINHKKVTLNQVHGEPFAGSDTVYLTAIDENGNACSFINSNYMGFGTGIVPRGWGFTLQNRGHNFSLDPNHPNALAPRKRPYHTIIPALATYDDGSLYASFGVMGGFMQPQGHVQVLLALVDDGLDPQTALDQPRVCLTSGTDESAVALEDGIPKRTVNKLAKMGHHVELIKGHARATFGRGQIIISDGKNGMLCGGSDPRADGCAIAQV
jgi:gamma-glutamyltranspeptidase/glutathione hydrolase